jgi:hypothetical protein
VGAEAAFEADAGLHTRCVDGISYPFEVFVGETNGFFDEKVFACFGSGDGLIGMKFVGRADVDDVNVGICDHFVVICIRFERGAVLRSEFVFVVIAAGTDGCDVCAVDGLKGVDVSSSHPPESDNADVEIAHECLQEYIAEIEMVNDRGMNKRFVGDVNINWIWQVELNSIYMLRKILQKPLRIQHLHIHVKRIPS